MAAKTKAKKENTTALTTTDEQKLAKYGDLADDMPVSSSDIMLSKVLAMQGQSKLVQDEKANIGEVRDSISHKLLAKKEEEIELILFKPFKTWIIFQVIDGAETYKDTIPVTPENASWEREVTVDGTKFVRYECMNYYTLSPSEIKLGDYRPRVLSLRSTAYKTAKKIETARAFLGKANIPLAFRVFKIYTSLQKNDKGSWYMLDVSEGRKSEDHELDAVKEWIGIIQSASVTVDESDVITDHEKYDAYEKGEMRKDDKF